ncbi:MAG TPA: bifunctional biotin--[acetyl-CoA-carboxylase] ligase/biotin operon repressor BirA [Gammaproteobacteria bacterium]|jgi:BirA family biotin operon repressor/biotin-[acetyl-CoA-carboxylase] ligase|nr:bifunctional biotin--[acetyl-CoA-carboxylase] ligase/biotin operon repressor BirA [Gammaproteobacteria bacterium]
MDRSHAILEVLADGHFHSGETLAQSLGVTRAAVWKKVRALEKLGLSVFRVPGKGYRLANPLQLLDADIIAGALSPACRARLKGMTILDRVDSTNTWLSGRSSDPEVCFAEFQSAGRGRRGRSWVSPFAANLYLSMSWRFDEWPPGFTALGMVTAIAAVRALEALGLDGVRIKWPNDLIAAGRKLGGVLIDIQGEPPGATRAVIGLGLNVRMPAAAGQDIDQPWMDLATLADGTPPERNKVAAALVEALFGAMQDFESQGFAAFAADWQALDLVAGKAVALHSHDHTVTGVAAGVDEQGALLLKTPQGLKRFVSGDLSLRIA